MKYIPLPRISSNSSSNSSSSSSNKLDENSYLNPNPNTNTNPNPNPDLDPNPNTNPNPDPDLCNKLFDLSIDIEILEMLEYKMIRDIVIFRGKKINKISSSKYFCCARTKYEDKFFIIIRIPSNLECDTTKNKDYILSYKTYCILDRPNYLCKQNEFVYIGFNVKLEDYIDNTKMREKGKQIIYSIFTIFN